jgi:hypothetical protein
MKNSLNGFNSSFNNAEEKASELENIATEVIHIYDCMTHENMISHLA